ncbi:hypothetical protein PRJ_5539 (plasmid) [Pseudomonas sp. XWY-1]|nr:hypothetical protein PRJ_5539 [Pseudomonas sp. XWY-1]
MNRPGYAYSKAEVLLTDLRPRGEFIGEAAPDTDVCIGS